MTLSLISQLRCQRALLLFSVLTLASCATSQPNERTLPPPQTCDIKTGICRFSWEVWREAPSSSDKSHAKLLVSGSSAYPIDQVTAVPFELKDGENNQFSLLFNIVSSSRSKSSVVALTGNIQRGSVNSTFEHKLALPIKGTHVQTSFGAELFDIYIYPPTFTAP